MPASMLEPTLDLIDNTTNAHDEETKKLLTDLYAQCKDLDAYGRALYDNIPEDELREVAQKLTDKGYTLFNLAWRVKGLLDHRKDPASFDAKKLSGGALLALMGSVQTTSYIEPVSVDVKHLVALIRSTVQTTCHSDNVWEKLAEHRHPIFRWLKEIMAMIGTLFVGTLVKTGINMYETYSADTEHFSLSKVPFGFFSNTESVNKVVALENTVNALEALDKSQHEEVSASQYR